MILVTERLILREFQEQDAVPILKYQSDARYLRFYAWTKRELEDVQAFVSQFLDWQIEVPRTKFQLAITLLGTGQLIGNCGLRIQGVKSTEAELGFEINPTFWNKGYATEAAEKMVAFGFNDMQIHRIWAHCIAENRASVRVLEKLGFRQEGRLRENQWIKGAFWDSLVFGLLSYEWLGIADKQLENHKR